MTTQISAETLSPITHKRTPVITTELLAQLYGTEPVRIRQGYARNAGRFVEGKHFFKLTGAGLKAFKNEVSLNDFVKIAPTTNHLILWTERGAARHAKMLETDQAWEVFEKLEDCYFSQKEKHQVPATKPTNAEERYRVRVIIYDNIFGGCVEMLGKGDTFRSIANGIATDLGYKPHAFTHVGTNKEKIKRIY
ncbi:Phage anti-repressor protein [Serratia entomophila]|uniref:ORF6N domain-containing protein n=1 Tax=Serratia entomophila TaxID=42906 RepID=UPI00217CA57F|nr:ORF6N domain-containing protein [Serratia entomophila]CAI1925032.1 Phage anti-repressor protein [Serratia entomophila]